jgi:hypothetical protein
VPSNVVAVTDRSVLVEAERAAWRPATAADVPGFYRSGEMTGALATALLRIEYLFDADGSFTGAALFAGPPPGFDTLSGSWTLDAEARLALDDAEPADLEAADGMLRLLGADGTVVLYREDLR